MQTVDKKGQLEIKVKEIFVAVSQSETSASKYAYNVSKGVTVKDQPKSTYLYF